jgi:L-amino acid N-acyltransferase YncA
VNIRKARKSDLPAITEIYNEAIANTTATFDTAPKTAKEQREWFEHHGSKYPIIVAEQEGRVVGWAALSQWSDRCAYSGTAEISLYVQEASQGRGIGRRLVVSAVAAGREAGLHSIIARIAEGNPASIHLHESMGFEHVGVMREVGRKFGRLLDVHVMQLVYR